jgi:hypothetical protein
MGLNTLGYEGDHPSGPILPPFTPIVNHHSPFLPHLLPYPPHSTPEHPSRQPDRAARGSAGQGPVEPTAGQSVNGVAVGGADDPLTIGLPSGGEPMTCLEQVVRSAHHPTIPRHCRTVRCPFK